MFSRNTLLISLSTIAFILTGLIGILALVMIVVGYPAPEWLPKVFGAKSIRKIYQLFLILGASGILIHPKRKEWLDNLFQGLTRACTGLKGITVLIVTYALLFTWNQITAYLSADINFLPFSFYDTMLHYFWQGKINFTGLLHQFYHTNNILYLFAPLWLLFKSSLLLIVLYGPLLALGALPLFLLTRRLFPNSWIPLAVSFLYLNFRYLLNLLEMNFLVESFYPLLIFTALYCLVAEKRKSFWLSVFLVLLIKEDAPFYMAALGGFLLFFKRKRSYGLGALFLSVIYGIFLTKIFIPLTGSSILEASAKNFQDVGSSPKEILLYYLTHPWNLVQKLFWPAEKIKTYLKLLQFTLFFPLLSPWFLMVLVGLIPPFCMWNDQYGNFFDLRFHYSAVVISFLFFAFVQGFKNLNLFLTSFRWKEGLVQIIFFVLLLIAGGNYLSHPINTFAIETIKKVSSLPQNAVVVTHGHLLPYLGYRPFNFYLSEHYEKPTHPYHVIYSNADYYFLARSINSYPHDKGWVEEKILKLKKDPKLQLIYDDGERVLFKRKGDSYQYPEELLPANYYAGGNRTVS